MKSEGMMILFASALALLVAAVFLFVRREDNDFAKLNESVREMVARSATAEKRSEESEKRFDEQLLMVEEIKKSHDEITLQLGAINERIDKVEKSGQKITVEIGEKSKPLFLNLFDSRESKKLTASPRVRPLVKDAKRVLKESNLSQ